MGIGLKIGFLAGLLLLLVFGFCLVGVITGGGDLQEGEPVTVGILHSISSFIGGFSESGAAAPVGVVSGSSVREVGAFQPDDPNYYGPEIHAISRPLPAEATEKKLIMSRNIDFAYTARSFEADISDGPLVITYYINEHDDTTIDSFLEVTVTDRTTGEVLLEDGYRRKYGAELKEEFTIYYEGPVRIDLYGNKVNADLLIYADE